MQDNKISKRIESIKKYIDVLSHHYSKLLILRVDLSYKKPFSNYTTLIEANRDVKRMLDNRRMNVSIFKENIGYVIKREFSKDRGVHFHALFIFDGQKIQKDVYKAEQIGAYWQNKITKGKGSYHNCHRNKYRNSGIGMLDYRDKEKRYVLDEIVIPYLCKDEQGIECISESGNYKAFIRSVVSKKGANLGRPRSVKEDDK